MSHQISFLVSVTAVLAVALTTPGGVARVAGTALACSVAAMFEAMIYGLIAERTE